MILYEFLALRGPTVRHAFVDWVDSLPQDARAKVLAKLAQLRDLTFSEAVTRKLIHGPLAYRGRKFPNIYKLKVNTATLALRPMLCPGPIATAVEVTLLVGAREDNKKLVPDPDVAAERRHRVLDDPTGYRRPFDR